MLPTVSLVRNRSDVHSFIGLAHSIYRRDPNWVPSLNTSLRKVLDPKANPFHREAEIAHFLARDETGRTVGRIAAVIHPRYIDRYGPKAFFGFFEAVRDERVARVLLETVEQWAFERGMKVVAGPYSYTSSQDVGFLIEGFDSPPALLQPYNPPYYVDLVRSCGYCPAFEMSTYSMSRARYQHRKHEMFDRGATVLERNHLTMRSVRMDQYMEELELLRQLYNKSFANHPESVPISRSVFHAQAAEFKQIVDPRLVRFIEDNGRPIGCSLLLPNLNEILIGGNGKLSLGLLLNWHRLMKKIKSVVVVLMGVDPASLGLGLGRCFAAEMVRAAATGQYETVHTTWVHEKNRVTQSLIHYLAPTPTKKYAVFEKVLC
jgi:hypothetical protein